MNQINANKNDSHFMDEVREGQAKAGRSGGKNGKEKGSVEARRDKSKGGSAISG
ncbi:hypothetical protein [Zoogloea sp.]|uniref:hypothetical protein n=1 Tax=Zoogloea sp. TaxID=49181 RepID=UPI0026059867|nr:hypothetical protein [Zoogloea sp.]